MFDIEKIKDLTVNEVIAMNDLLNLAKEAKSFADLIQETYKFPIGVDKINLHFPGEGEEYITHDGVWHGKYKLYSCDVDCSEDSIFKYLKAECLISHGICRKADEQNHATEEWENTIIARRFRSFINRTRELYERNKAN